MNILQYLIFSFCLEKRWDRGKIKFRSVPLLSLSWWSLANIPCDSNLINQRQAKWSRRSSTPLPSREVFFLHKDKSTISEYSPVFDFQLLSGKALRQGEDQISICTLIELILMKSSEYTLWFQSHQSKTSQMVKKVFNTTPFQGTLSPAQRQVNNQWCSPVYWFSAFGWNRIRTGGKSNLYLTPYWAYLDKIK